MVSVVGFLDEGLLVFIEENMNDRIRFQWLDF